MTTPVWNPLPLGMGRLKILILEDCPERQKKFCDNLMAADSIVIVENPSDAKAKLNEEEWDVLFLDHDLGGQVYQESKEGTGWEVADWLSKNESRKPPTIICHSLNTAGRNNMLSLLPGAIDLPWAWELVKIQNITKAVDVSGPNIVDM